ncbi:Uncharacterised protein [Actinomyces bovis]|uniref:CopG family transcriptional regulator n=1 Tax=Actinomyces bovis TaxID=1658 RepID=A0ABY1VN03_9ACTO|nr:hypothetical protein [Actinomyces bovis]SPT53491.1 Uncharacterised protein [Actinomyces bovis]VEG55395.1 Uncharacterised protein [Actinomyces israelii]
MKPAPKPRKAVTVPKATGPDPAELPAIASTASTAVNAGRASRAVNDSIAGSSRKASNAGDARRKVTLRLDEDVLGRARTAWANSLALGEATTFNDWLVAAVEAATTEAEARLNGGRPFAPTPAGVIPRGRLAQ